MKGNRVVLAVVMAVVVIAAAWWLLKRGSSAPAVQLIPMLDSAVKRPADGTFEIIDAELNGETRQAISTVTPSRVTYKVRIPDDAWLKVAVGTKPESWTQEGDGVEFRFGVSDGRTFEEPFTQHVNPFANSGDRKWIQVWVDLGAYAGEEVELIFNTRSSAEGKGDDTRNDHALWGAPELVIR